MARKIQINLSKQPNTKEGTASWVGHTIVIGYFKNVTLFTGSLESDTINNNDSDPKKIKPQGTKGVSSNKETDTTNQRIISSTGKKFGDAFRTLPIDNNGNASIDLPDLVFGASESSEDEPNVNLFAVTISVIAPNGSLLLRQDFNTQNNTILNISNSSFISSDSVVMPVPPVNQVDLSNIPSTPPATLRIKGKAVDLQGQRAIKNQQVILWETFPDDATKPAKVIQIAFTDNQGNFTCDVPNKEFTTVDATVALAPTQRIPVSLKVSEKVEENGRIEDFIYLVLSNLPSLSGEEEDCSCHDVTPYLPNAEELVSDQYSQDIGGSCTNFTKPNRVLEEFDYYSVVRTTDPKIKAMTNTVENATVDSLLDGIQNPYINTESAKADPNLDMNIAPAQFSGSTLLTGRQEISEENSIDWDATPTSYQATTIAHGHLLHFKQRFKAAGYSLGDLLYSLPLAPGQKKQIVMYDWDRKDSAARSEELSAEDRLTASLSRDRDISDIASGVVNEKIRGGSDVEEKSKGWDVGASVSVPLPGAVIGVEGGYSSTTTNTNSTAWQDSSRSTVMNSMQSLRDKTQQSASSVRNQRTSVIQSFDQSEHYGVTSEVIANHNHCHAVTMQYFEVLRHFAIEQDLTDVQECLFIPLQLGFFDKYKILRWKNILRNNLRISKTGYYRHPLYKAFDVLEKYVANPNYKPEHPIADQQITEIKGEISLSFNLSIPSLIPVEETETVNGKVNIKTVYKLDVDAWQPYIYLLDGTGYEETTFLESMFTNSIRKGSDQANVFYQRLVPVIIDKYLEKLFIAGGSFPDTPIFFSTINKRIKNAKNNLSRQGALAKGGKIIGESNFNVSVSFNATLSSGVTRRQFEKIGFVAKENLFSNTPIQLPSGSEILMKSCQLRYETAKYQGMMFNALNIQQNLNGDDVTFFTPCNAIELRDPAKEEWDACVLLVTHLNEFIEYYHKVLWLNMDPDKRFMLLDGYNVTYETEIKSDGTRVEHKKSLASVLENRLIGIVGNCLVMPVSRGYQLDPTFKAQPGQIVNLLDHYKPTTPIPPFRISVPTKGVFAEAVMGACNSCEKIDDTRFWKWEEHPIPDPTAINPITAPTPQYQSQDMTAKDFAQPIVNIQNAPQAPEYKGLDAVQGVVNAPFKDITGLEGNQRNANDAFRQTGERIGNAMDGAERAMIAGGQYALARNQQILDALAALNGLPIPPEQKEKIYNDLMNNFRNNKASDLGREQQTSDVDAIKQLNKDGKISDEQAAKYTDRALAKNNPMTMEEAMNLASTMPDEYGRNGYSYSGLTADGGNFQLHNSLPQHGGANHPPLTPISISDNQGNLISNYSQPSIILCLNESDRIYEYYRVDDGEGKVEIYIGQSPIYNNLKVYNIENNQSLGTDNFPVIKNNSFAEISIAHDRINLEDKSIFFKNKINNIFGLNVLDFCSHLLFVVCQNEQLIKLYKNNTLQEEINDKQYDTIALLKKDTNGDIRPFTPTEIPFSRTTMGQYYFNVAPTGSAYVGQDGTSIGVVLFQFDPDIPTSNYTNSIVLETTCFGIIKSGFINDISDGFLGDTNRFDEIDIDWIRDNCDLNGLSIYLDSKNLYFFWNTDLVSQVYNPFLIMSKSEVLQIKRIRETIYYDSISKRNISNYKIQ